MTERTEAASGLTKRLGRRRVLGIGAALAGGGGLLRPAPAPASAADPRRRLTQAQQAQERSTTVAYDVEGRLLEVCTCGVLCPCWVGEDPDGGTCDSSFAWHIDRGSIEGVDVTGRTLALSVHIPGNVLQGNWRAAVFVDDQATTEQQDAMLKLWTGELGGAIADLAALIGEVVSVERVPISFEVEGGSGTLKIGTVADAELAPFLSATGDATVLQDTVFSTIPGSPAYVGKAKHYRRDGAQHGLKDIDVTNNNAIQGTFRFTA